MTVHAALHGVVVTGSFRGCVDFGDAALINNSTNLAVFVARLEEWR